MKIRILRHSWPGFDNPGRAGWVVTFELLNVAQVEGRWHYTFSGAGEVFSVVRPVMGKGMERRVREEVKGG